MTDTVATKQHLAELRTPVDADLVMAQRDVYEPSLSITPDYFGIDLAFDRFDRMLELRLQVFEWRLTARLGAIMLGGLFATAIILRHL